jgi:Zn-dependent M28 family amino/carboxypeptidase
MTPQTQHLFQTVVPFRTYDEPLILGRVVDYIQDYFLNTGLLVELQKWEAHGQEYVNIIAYYNPGHDSRLVVGAHYDVCGDQSGADDNASAVAGLLETARLLALHQPQLDYTIELVAYCLEEPPFFGTELKGSFTHAKS